MKVRTGAMQKAAIPVQGGGLLLPCILNDGVGGLLTIWEEGRNLPPIHQAERRA